ncbi:MAG: alpha/beta hydrolase [Bacteroidetes bacterium]|nr:alpha/beta hydrolase [Bacteroidota bacterium]HET6245066.1 alpha/beta hydrolase [Bacteroidia bacterium]
MKSVVLLTLPIFLTSFLWSTNIRKSKDIPYKDKTLNEFDPDRHILDIFYPEPGENKREVLVFVHGGSWNTGSKNRFHFIGNRMAKKGIVTVLINYRLSPSVKYDKMAEDCAAATDWVYKNISKFGGDPKKITVAGHSAGGHLVALITLGNTFKDLNLNNPIKKTILIDAFGLDMVSYFEQYNNNYSKSLRAVFTTDPRIWRKASPIYHIPKEGSVPFLVFTGSKTYKTISESSEMFCHKLNESGNFCSLKVIKGRNHFGMIAQLYFRNNPMGRDILSFLKEPYFPEKE